MRSVHLSCLISHEGHSAVTVVEGSGRQGGSDVVKQLCRKQRCKMGLSNRGSFRCPVSDENVSSNVSHPKCTSHAPCSAVVGVVLQGPTHPTCLRQRGVALGRCLAPSGTRWLAWKFIFKFITVILIKVTFTKEAANFLTVHIR